MSFGKSAATISDLELKIKDIEVMDWLVGEAKRKKISRGVRVTFELPQVSFSDAKKLKEEFGLDSWLIKIERVSIGRTEVLGNFYIQVFSNNGGNFRDMQATQSSVNIHYAASAISERLDRMSCPALDHRFQVGGTDLGASSHSSQSELTITKGLSEPISFNPVKLNFSMFKINGGGSLVGSYRISLIAYDSLKKRVLSSEVVYRNLAKVESEQRLSLTKCLNSSGSDLEKEPEAKFKFGR